MICCRQHQKNWLQLSIEAEMKYKEDMIKLQKQLESEHLTDLTFQKFQYASECEGEKAELLHYFKKWYMETADKEIKTRDKRIKDLQNAIDSKENEISHNKEAIKDIIKQFQKFINFALNEKPSQAEFVLSLQKILKDAEQKRKQQPRKIKPQVNHLNFLIN